MKLDNAILKNLLPGLAPLLIFIVIESIFGLEAGLIAAVVFGLLELVYTFIKTKKLEKFILIDTALLVAMGIVSLISNNDTFFKLKPAIIEGIMALLLAVSVFTPKNIMLDMSKRYMKGMTVSEAGQKQMAKSLKVMFFIVLAHIALIIFSVFYLSDAAWAFISGVLFYLIIAGYFGFEFLKNKVAGKRSSKEEPLPIVNAEGKIIGKAPISLCHNGREKPMHPAVHLHIFNGQNELFLRNLPLSKDGQSGKWETAVVRHIAFGEELDAALKQAIRSSIGEMGPADSKAGFVAKYAWENEREKELVFLFSLRIERGPDAKTEGPSGGRFWSSREIKENSGSGIFTPNLEFELKVFNEQARAAGKPAGRR